MKTLSIITINRNNASGLEKTMRSVLLQTSKDFEYVVVDGASTDGSIDVIRQLIPCFGDRMKWISEPDKGIYNAMNKGLKMASGEYVQFLNSGDSLASNNVVERMYQALEQQNYPSILYGNMLKEMCDGSLIRDKCFAGQEITFMGFYTGTLNHSPAFIRTSLFSEYGPYDESHKIVSDWEWYLLAIIFGREKPVYVNLDITRFDMTGISETNKLLDKSERDAVLRSLLPTTVLADYERWCFPIEQHKRIQRYPWANKLVWLLERCLFKWEKWQQKRHGEVQYQQ